jgi:hypothetical protein
LQALEKLNNYNTLMGIIAGLNLASVKRLKKTWRKVSDQKMESLKKLEKLMDTESSYASYRKAISSASDHFLPYLGNKTQLQLIN